MDALDFPMSVPESPSMSCKKIVGPAITQRFIPTDHLPKQKHGAWNHPERRAWQRSWWKAAVACPDMNTAEESQQPHERLRAGCPMTGPDDDRDLQFPYCKGCTTARDAHGSRNQRAIAAEALAASSDIVVGDKSGVVIPEQNGLVAVLPA